MNRKRLLRKLKEFADIEEDKVVEKTFRIGNMSFAELRDCLTGLGTILDEDFDNSTYVINISAGFANMNSALTAVELNKNSVDCIGYSREGLINQHTAEKAMEKISKRIKKTAGRS